MIDEDFRTWLIEVNTNPYLGIPNDFIRNLLPKMINEMLYIALDQVYGPKKGMMGEKDDFGFELIYSEGNSLWSDQKVNVRRGFWDGVYPIESLKQEVGEDNKVSPT